MRMQIYGTVERRKKSALTYYLMAALVGVGIFFVLLIVFKGGFFLIKAAFGLVKDYWLFLLGGITAILIIRKTLFRRRMARSVMHQPEM